MSYTEMLEKVRNMSDAELYNASLEKGKKGYTPLANMAYTERQRRSNSSCSLGSVRSKCGKYTCDFYYDGKIIE